MCFVCYQGNLLKHYKERHPGCTPPERYLMKADGDSEGLSLDKSSDDLAMDITNVEGWPDSASEADNTETSVS